MGSRVQSVLKTFAKVFGVLVALGVFVFVLSLVGFLFLFRTREEAPIGELEAKRRLKAEWIGPAQFQAKAIRILYHRKEIIWDGTTHEEWTAFVPGNLKLDAIASPFLRINNPGDAWPLPEVAVEARYQALPAPIYVAESATHDVGSEGPTRTHAVLWPVASGHIVRYQLTVID